MFKKKKKSQQEVNASSMADIAFLLLIFFLVTTTIPSDKGLTILLPPKQDVETDIKVKDRNVFKILVNTRDELLVEDEPMELGDLKDNVKEFLNNKGRNPDLSDSPSKAVVSLKTDRGTSYNRYIEILDRVKRAYHELRAEFLGVSLQDYLSYNETEELKNKCLGKKVDYFAEKLQIDEMTPRKFLNFDPAKSRDQKKRGVYFQAVKLCKPTFAEKFYEAKRAYPLQISEAEPSNVGGN